MLPIIQHTSKAMGVTLIVTRSRTLELIWKDIVECKILLVFEKQALIIRVCTFEYKLIILIINNILFHVILWIW